MTISLHLVTRFRHVPDGSNTLALHATSCNKIAAL